MADRIVKSRGNPRCANPEHIAPKYIGTDGFARCRECKKEYHASYIKAHPELKKLRQSYKKTWIAKNPERHKAQVLAKSNRKRLVKPECEHCSATERLEMHHPDYSKPLEVVTLCKSCHEGVHHEVTVA